MYERLKGIFCSYSNSEEYRTLGEIPEVKASGQLFQDYAERFDREKYLSLEELATTNNVTNEMQGFIYGFRYAIQIMSECISTKQ